MEFKRIAMLKFLYLSGVKDTIPIHEVQLLNYLKATGLEIGLLINFGYSVVVKRKIFKKPG